MERTNWRSAATYEHAQGLDTVGFAFEYLRRNPRYVEDALRASETTFVEDRSANERMRRWCLYFRRRSTDSVD
ncbi:transcriptional regulator domain-containing protein [Chelatococcus reniformis]|uniref:Transcriptional regulator-like domain-containing protein n=1 Tax=Chelatococcus reniformis TaxID=1494448 RepID=A0A916UY87_9HYPH|nr:DUF6499 domain-containing protein [Chelatococcus reniformis]GGC94230.1 hypothetical protein GCM10010994_60020 [Chelatococcus reniformis]